MMLKTYKGIRRDYTGKTNEDGDVAYVEEVNKWLKEQAASPETPQADVALNDLLADLKTQVGKAAMARLFTDLKYRVYQHEYVGIELPLDDYADYQHDIKVLEALGV